MSWIKELAPDLHGPAGRAWCFVFNGEDRPQAQTTLGSWLLFAPGAHPFWEWHVMAAITLADVEGFPPAHRNYPQAEYELLVLALNPDHEPPDPRMLPEPLRILTPPDVLEHFHDVPGGDDRVRGLLRLFADAVVNGHLVPDSDHRRSWRESLDATLEHYRAGVHG